MCFSRPLLLPWVSWWSRERLDRISTGAERVASKAASDETESTLVDSSGTSLLRGLDLEKSIAGVVVNCGCDSQQSVSRFHIRQLKFSSRRPSSMESAHREKTKRRDLVGWLRLHNRATLTSPHAKQVLDISGVNLVHLCRINREHRGCQSDRHSLAIVLQFLLRRWLTGWR